MRIDVHQHVNWQGYTAADLVTLYDTIGIDKACLLTWENIDGLTGSYIHLSYEHMIAAVKQYPKRFIPWYAPDPRNPRAEQRLLAAVKKGLMGFGELKVQVALDHPNLRRLFAICSDHGLPVLIHMDKAMPPDFTQWYCFDINTLGRVCDLFPHVNFIGHGPGFWRYVSGDEDKDPSAYPTGKVTPRGKLPQLLRKHKNLYCDISAGSGLFALSRDRAWGKRFILNHSRRILYGTDEMHRAHLDYLEALNLPAPVMKRIMAGNLLRLLPRPPK